MSISPSFFIVLFSNADGTVPRSPSRMLLISSFATMHSGKFSLLLAAAFFFKINGKGWADFNPECSISFYKAKCHWASA